ncbi:MAG: hypothetical protein HC819_13715 [Cyclobacteriaceae bacterium]|nr:hypothetical protein [Cyclobacteriaceae bacterium]
MKKAKLITVLYCGLVFLTTGFLYAQDSEMKNHIWMYEGKKSQQRLGAYLAMDGVYHALDGQSTGLLGIRGALVWNSRWGVGLMGQALWYDEPLDEVVSEGTYHLQAGLAGLYIEYQIPLNENWRTSIMLASGSGLTLYQYDKDDREGKNWYEEIIDRDTFGFVQPTIEIRRKIGGLWWIGAEVGFMGTSELHMQGLPSDFLNGIKPGFSITYGLF